MGPLTDGLHNPARWSHSVRGSWVPAQGPWVPTQGSGGPTQGLSPPPPFGHCVRGEGKGGVGGRAKATRGHDTWCMGREV